MGKDTPKKVRFHGRVQFKTIRHVKDFSDEDIKRGWYRKRDFARMSEEVSKIAAKLQKGVSHVGGEEICVRGLEHLVEEDVADYRAEKMIASVDLVLDMQEDQRDEGDEDPETIARLYGEIAAPLQKEAYLIALEDAQEAQLAMEAMDDDGKEKPKKQKRKKSIKKDTTLAMPQRRVSDPISAVEDVSRISLTSPDTTESVFEPLPEEADSASVRRGDDSVSSGSMRFGDDSYNSLKFGDSANSLKFGDSASSLDFLGQVHEAKTKSPTPSKPKVKAVKGPSAPNLHKEPPSVRRKKKKDWTGGSERSPLVRRLDGSYAFRNTELETAREELSKQRKQAVRDSLFKHLDSPVDQPKGKVQRPTNDISNLIRSLSK